MKKIKNDSVNGNLNISKIKNMLEKEFDYPIFETKADEDDYIKKFNRNLSGIRKQDFLKFVDLIQNVSVSKLKHIWNDGYNLDGVNLNGDDNFIMALIIQGLNEEKNPEFDNSYRYGWSKGLYNDVSKQFEVKK